MPLRHPAALEKAMLRVAALALSVTWPLWITEAFARKFPGSTGGSHWYPLTTMTLFALANTLLLIACLSGKRGFLLISLRTAASTLPVALALLTCQIIITGEAPPGIWFTVFTSIPSLAFALTVPLRIGLPVFAFSVGGVTLLNALLSHPSDLLSIGTEVTFSLVYSLPLALIACATLQLARFIDSAGYKTHTESITAARLRARAEETTRFTALVHDNVLSTLSGITNGVLPTEPVGLRLTSVFDEAGRMSAEQLIDAVTTTIHEHTTDCTITADAPTTLVLPGTAGANITLVVAEIAKNSRRHAGAGVDRTCHISLSDTDIHLSYTDNGSGFSAEDVRPTAAGLRVSILKRMESIDGGSATVTSTPGQGTTVDITWRRTTPPKPVTQKASSAATDVRRSRFNRSGMRTYDLMHLSYAICVPYGVIVAILFTCMNILNGHPLSAGNLTTNILIVVLVGLLVSGHAYRVSLPRAGICTIGVILLMEAGQWQDLSTAPGWSYGWHIMAASLLCALLALRGRPAIALGTLFSGAAVVELTTEFAATPDLEFGVFRILMSSLLVASCALVSFGIRHTLTRLPDARQQLRESELRTVAAEEASAYRQDHLQRLRKELAPLVKATKGLTDITDELKEHARLTELQIRDAIRSPLLDLEAVHTAARTAREEGVVVQLIDDRTGSTEDTSDIDARLHEALVQRVLTSLRMAESGMVTVRLLPRGRSAFATISDGTGIHRYSGDGQLLTLDGESHAP